MTYEAACTFYFILGFSAAIGLFTVVSIRLAYIEKARMQRIRLERMSSYDGRQ